MTQDFTIAGAAKDAAESGPLPPLRLHHFFVWTAVSAFLLAITSSFYAVIPELERWWMATALPSILGGALALCCAGYGLAWRRRGLPFPLQPGHGLVLWHAAAYIISLVHSLLWWAIFRPSEFSDWNTSAAATRFLEWGQALQSLASVGLLAWCAWCVRPARRWQVVFLLNALVAGHLYIVRFLEWNLLNRLHDLQLVGPFLAAALSFLFQNLPFLIPGIALAVAVVRDRRDRIPRHWSHWAGVVVWCAMFLGTFVFALISTGWLPQPFTLERDGL